MRFFKLILVSLVMLCVAVLFVFSLFPSQIRISRVISVHSSKEKIAAALNDLNAWSRWNEFINQPKTKKIISTPSIGEGANIESGAIRITMLHGANDTIKTSWLQKDREPFEGGFIFSQTQDDNIVVEWYFNFHFKWYPWEKLGSMFYDKQLGPVMEKSLANLKNYTENP